MNPKLIEGALAMLARLIPPEEYAKATAHLGEIVKLLRQIEDRMARVEQLTLRVQQLEAAAAADSPAFASVQAEQAMFMVPGTIEAALAPAERKPGHG